MRPLFVRTAEPLPDAEWLNMFANSLQMWFSMPDALAIDSPRFFQLDAFRNLVKSLGDTDE